MKVPKRVTTAKQDYERANEAMRDFEDEHEEVFSEYRNLVAAREAAREHLVVLVRETGFGVCGMIATSVPDREVDANLLYDELEGQPQLRDQLVRTSYRVDWNAFSRARDTGAIPSSLANRVIVREGTKYRVDNQLPETKLS